MKSKWPRDNTGAFTHISVWPVLLLSTHMWRTCLRMLPSKADVEGHRPVSETFLHWTHGFKHNDTGANEFYVFQEAPGKLALA